MFRIIALAVCVLTGFTVRAAPVTGAFESIDGGHIDLAQFRGQPVLVVNTASLCGFTRQYAGLQELSDRFGPRGLVVLATPSNDFNQELASEAEVKSFCALNYGLDLQMTEILSVKGPQAHPFYQQVRQETGFVPQWNFNKILIAPDGSVAATWRSSVKPTSRRVTQAIEALISER